MEGARPESTHGLLTQTRLHALVAELALFPPATRARGQHYATTGRVGPLGFEDDAVVASVRGTHVYEVAWQWLDAGDVGDEWAVGWEPSCTCPVAPECKHVYALACRVLAHARLESGFTHPALDRLAPQALDMELGLVPRASNRVAERPEPRRAAAPVRSPALERIRSAADLWTREQALAQLLAEDPGRSCNGYLPPFPEILGDADPDLRCWRLVQEILRRTGGWLPAALGPYRERPDLAARHAEQARAALARALASWATQRRAAPERSLRLVFGLAESLVGRLGVTVEARVTTPRLVDAPRTMMQLRQLRTEAHRTPGLLPADEVVVLDWLVDRNAGSADAYYPGAPGLTTVALRSVLERVSGSPLARWTTDLAPALAACGGVRPGSPVVLRPETVRLLPACVTRDGEAWIELRFLWPDGRERRLDEVVYLRGTAPDVAGLQPSLALADGAFFAVGEEPPSALLERFHEIDALPLPAAERATTLALLAASFPHLRETLAAHTRVHAVTPAVALDLRDDDWLQLRLFAHTGGEQWHPATPPPTDTVVFEYSPERAWVRAAPPERGAAPEVHPYESIPTRAAAPAATDGEQLAGPAPAADSARADAPVTGGPSPADRPAGNADVWIEAPDPETVAPAVAWLDSTRARAGTKRGPGGQEPRWEDRQVGWWLAVSRRRMEELAEAWERRPPGVTYFGTPRIRRLLTGADRLTPRLRLEASGIDWLAVSAEWEAEGMRLSDADLAKLRAATTRFVRLESGWVRREVAAVGDATACLLADLGVEIGAGPQRLSQWQLAGARPETLQALQHEGADPETLRALEALRESIRRFAGLPPVPTPAGLEAVLRPYQQRGLEFLAFASALGVGAVLADDMGLGKTVQALAWLLHLRERERGSGPSLVVCPASVLHNWAREAARFAPGLRVLLLTSGEARRAAFGAVPGHDLVVTTYALLRRDLEAWRGIELHAAILDEAQNIKNPDAAVTRAALALRARHRLALTGTPLENRALDLWSIVSFANPGYLGARAAFAARFDRADAQAQTRALLAARLRPVLLRRTKREVAPELPERIEERRDCELTKGQRQFYLAELRRSRALVEKLSGAPGGLAQNKISILAALTRLRQICCHPALAGGQPLLGSGKFEALFELLEPLLAEGHKVLLFSQFVRCLRLLADAMRARAIVHHTLTGATVKREAVVTAFQDDPRPCVFLVSLRAGGTGLNLTAASYVVLFDPWWNPAVEAQAIDRSHRIGQDRTVIAYRMLAEGTIEEKIWELQQRKAALTRDILGEGGFARSLTRDDLDYLLAEA